MEFTLRQITLLLVVVTYFSACSKTEDQLGKTLLPGTNTPQTLSPNSDAETQILIAAVKKTGAKSINGNATAKICALARPHLNYMIEQGEISHDHFDERSGNLRNIGGTQSGEIVAYNCSGSMSAEKGAESCATAWRNSSGHWAIMQKYWDGFCYAMKRTENCYYCIGLFSNGKW